MDKIIWFNVDAYGLFSPISANQEFLQEVLEQALEISSRPECDEYLHRLQVFLIRTSFMVNQNWSTFTEQWHSLVLLHIAIKGLQGEPVPVIDQV